MFAAPCVAYVMIWMFLLGGILDRYARQRRLGAHGFFAASGVFFFRFLRLGVLALMAWTFVFGALHGWLFHGFYGWVTRESTVERTAFLWHAVLTVAFVLVVAAVMVVFDYAKVRAVVEDRRSMIGALLAGARFVRRHASAAAAVFAAERSRCSVPPSVPMRSWPAAPPAATASRSLSGSSSRKFMCSRGCS